MRVAALAEAADLADGQARRRTRSTPRGRSSRRRASGSGSGSRRRSSRSPGRPASASRSSSTRSTGTELAAVGRRRPTTSAGQAAVWGDGGEALLDWLEIPRRHRLGSGGARRGASCCSTCRTSTRSRRRIASRRNGSSSSRISCSGWSSRRSTRMRALHERYLRPLAAHVGSMAVVLNQADLLSAGGRRRLARRTPSACSRRTGSGEFRCSSCRRAREPACPS